MYVLAVVGPSDSGKTTLVSQLCARLAPHGTVGSVKHLTCEPDIDTEGRDTDRHRSAGAVQTYGIGDDGWFATGESLSLSEALDTLALSCEYALVEGYSDYDLPKVVLGVDEQEDVDQTAGKVLASGPEASDIDIDAVIERLTETEPYETLPSLVERVKQSADSEFSGAIATFTGRVRAKEGPEDDRTEFLEFEKYDGVAAEKLATIREELEARDGVYEVLLYHKTGVVEAEEDIVFVVVLAGHRDEAFETVEDGINRLKDEVPLFKKEVTVNDEFWAHEGP